MSQMTRHKGSGIIHLFSAQILEITIGNPGYLPCMCRMFQDGGHANRNGRGFIGYPDLKVEIGIYREIVSASQRTYAFRVLYINIASRLSGKRLVII